ncbi:hypothetical protein, partial [Streptomyces scabiei]|uniref:hypothetical protein n=1 Tax=Streptomyces scabiei TaxID=1930 RepID=UPI0038F81AF3
WIDYWASYNKIDFFIELKHSFASYLGGTITEVTSRRWGNANQQTKDCIDSLLILKSSKGFMTTAIQVIPIYETVKFDN